MLGGAFSPLPDTIIVSYLMPNLRTLPASDIGID
jgi:hypothetical protein